MGLNDPFKKLKVEEVQGPDRRVTAPTAKPLQTEILLQDVLRETKDTRDAVGKLANSVMVIGHDVARLKSESEERARKHSGSIKTVSNNDLKQDAALAKVMTTQTEQGESLKALHAKTDYQTRLMEGGKAAAVKVWNHPYAKWLVLAVIGYIAMVLKKHGMELPMP